jgi:16S rRNA (guanine527-N7)-methyltransferase
MNLEELVSGETIVKFNIYKNMLKEWNNQTLLVQVDTLNDFIPRHVIDSLQIIPLILETDSLNDLEKLIQKKSMVSILDIGSGSGFPGMILAMCGFANITLCESNLKKCIFLEEVARKTNTPVTIINSRAENLKKKYEIIVSRACCDLERLYAFMNGVSNENGATGIFHKGASWKSEVRDASIKWDFDLKTHKSITNEESVVLIVQKLQKQDIFK